jgi:hypothetical protein
LRADVFDASPTPLKTLNGRLSRLPPKTEDGARARTEALVSKEFRRRRFDEEARVRIDALSVRMLFAVATLYVTECPCGARCGGTAAAGEGGNWWENCTCCVLVVEWPWWW